RQGLLNPETGNWSGSNSGGGSRSALSSAYKNVAMPICRRLFKQYVCLDFSFARDNAGRSIDARMAMMAMTTSSSIKVKAEFRFIGSVEFEGSLGAELVFQGRSKETIVRNFFGLSPGFCRFT